MKIFGIGVDIVENRRFKTLFKKKNFINRICSHKEKISLKQKKQNFIFS